MSQINCFRQKQRLRAASHFIKRKLRSALSSTIVGTVYRYCRDTIRKHRSARLVRDVQFLHSHHPNRLLIVFPVITWESRWQRPQHVVSGLCQKGFTALYLAMTITAVGRKFANKEEAAQKLHFNALLPNVIQAWLSSVNPRNIYSDALSGDDLHNLLLGAQAAIETFKRPEIIYLVQFPGWTPLALALRESMHGKLVFDCMDDHSGFSTNSSDVLKTEEDLIKRSDMVIASSDRIEQKCRLLNSNTIQVKNATDFSHFATPVRNTHLDSLTEKPIIGYYGAISEWFDAELIVYCARRLPEFNFVLIGATFGCDTTEMETISNIHLLGEIPYRDLPGYLAYFDVCTIPFKIIPLTLATNPVKFYEYISAGKPVVSVQLPELIPYQQDCYLAADFEEFHIALLRAFAERQDASKIASRIRLAQANAWETRIQQIMDSPVFGE